ncbi:putative kinase [Saccharothrix ecbatanensis]|uniref:Putative kinase n=1 Tax=Saccharothrix ecbatanensis TaxID=1105145 RepID=A0A7W9M1G3_9PSEU|nr:RNA ligase family protein [Saccharothrix ecbatanensis]MBB5803935.1 putative kinase [Saccharothrix ecbatanensis]
MRTSYPRTPHLPWSPGVSTDDVRIADLGLLRGREVVVTEKLDGENTTLYADGMHARSLDSAHHPSRSWVKGLQGRIGSRLPHGWRICGENVYARHSIDYSELESWFYGFSVWDGDRCLDWDRTVRFLRDVGVPAPPVLWRGVFDERAIRKLRVDTARQEGFVVRAVDGFTRAEFGQRVAKWVRARHVRTDTHWMTAPVVENGLGPASVLWDVRSGASFDAAALFSVVGVEGDVEPAASCSVGTGDARLAGVLAAGLHRVRRGRVMTSLAGSVGVGVARRVGDLVGLHRLLHEPFPDEARRAGLLRMSTAVDLDVLHAVSAAVSDTRAARDQVAWSALHAEDVGSWERLRTGLRERLGDGPIGDRCWAEARDASIRAGRVLDVAEAEAATWRWRSGFPALVQMVGLSGSGKTTFAAGLPDVDVRVSLDDLRADAGDRADQRANGRVLRDGLDRLDAALRVHRTVVWDATSLVDQQRSLVHAVARRHDAMVTHAVVLVDEREVSRRNATRAHAVPAAVLDAQARRFSPPYPWQAHRTWYVGAASFEGEL